MPRYLIEVDHDGDLHACIHAVQVFHATGSHLLTHADWGCRDGVHRAWLKVEVEDRAQASGIVPPAFRARTRIIELDAFTPHDLERLISDHVH